MKVRIRMLALLLVCALLLPATVLAFDPPPIPTMFAGNVTIKGSPAGDGTSIDVYADGTNIGACSVDSGAYLYLVYGEHIGKTIRFEINGVVAGQAVCPPPVPPIFYLDLIISNASPVAVADVERYLVPVGAMLTFDGSNSYDPDGEICIYQWDFGDGSGEIGNPVSYSYAEVGIYSAKLTVTDSDGETDTDDIVVVIFDPAAGFVSGGGWIESPEGAYTVDPSLTGKASFGFISKYKKGADTPTGQTEFRFKVGNLNFHSESYDWLVIAGAKAKYKGIGSINGDGSYKFMLTGIDADVNANDAFDIDRFRIKIWEEDEGVEAIFYDNALGDDSDQETTVIGGGSIKIHK